MEDLALQIDCLAYRSSTTTTSAAPWTCTCGSSSAAPTSVRVTTNVDAFLESSQSVHTTSTHLPGSLVDIQPFLQHTDIRGPQVNGVGPGLSLQLVFRLALAVVRSGVEGRSMASPMSRTSSSRSSVRLDRDSGKWTFGME